MTDFVLRAPDKATMYAAFDALGLVADGGLRTQGMTSDGGAWCLVDQGVRYHDDVVDEYWVPLRWNSGDPTPGEQPGVQIVWRSDAEDPGEYPAGVTRFA